MITLHLSPNGHDTNPGTPDAPLATAAGARDRLRVLRRAGQLPAAGAVVECHAGCYRLDEPLALTAEDGGTAEAPVIYRAREGETVRLLGGRRLEPAAFTPVGDPPMLARLAPEARPHVRQCDLRHQGVTDLGAFVSRGFNRKAEAAHLELFFNREPMTVAQWPDAGQFTHITGFTKPIRDEWGAETGDLSGGFTYAGDRPKRWAPSDDIWVHGYWAYDWANSYEHVRRLDPDCGVVETEGGLYYFRKNQRFCFLNVLEELDQPGEFHVDRATGILYFWPPAAMEEADILVSEIERPLITLDDVSHVRFEGLTLEAGRDCGIAVTGGEAVAVTGCLLRNLGTWGVTIKGGRQHTVAGCDITGTGDGGVSITGGDRATLAPCDHAVVNCHIHHFARWSRCYVAGIGAGGVGMRFAHNLIHDAPHNAILFWGNDFLIENNEIYRVCLETGDAGAIYTGRDYTFRGNLVRRNFIHHMGGVGMGSMAIYNDDCVSGTQMLENIFWRCQIGIMLGGGRDFVVDNNIFVECRPAIHADARGVDDNPVWRNMLTNTMKKSLEAMRHHEPPYSVRYPEIAGVDPYYAKDGRVPPEHNQVSRNLCWKCDGWISACWPAGAENGVIETDNWVGADPGFADPDFGDFSLKGEPPVPGFRPIPLAEIGLVRDATRRMAPPRVRAALLPEGGTASGKPARLRLVVRNDGTTAARGSVRLESEGCAVAGEARVAYALSPGESTAFDLLAQGSPGLATVRALSDDSVMTPALCRLDLPHALPRLPSLPEAAEALAAALGSVDPLRIVQEGMTVGEIRLAWDGQSLAVHLHAQDTRVRPNAPIAFSERNPWEMPFFGLLGAPVEGGAIRQIVFFPDGSGQGRLWTFEGPQRVEPPLLAWRAQPNAAGGYTLTARIPAEALGLRAGMASLRLQGMLGAQAVAHAQTVLPLFGPRFAANDRASFCLCHLPRGGKPCC